MNEKVLRRICGFAAFLAVFFLLSGCRQQESRREEMRDEIFAYVLKNKSELDHNGGLYVCYDIIGEPDGWVEFGYVYSDYKRTFGINRHKEYPNVYFYDRGIRRDLNGEWVYEEQICSHWYYYEVHPY